MTRRKCRRLLIHAFEDTWWTGLRWDTPFVTCIATNSEENETPAAVTDMIIRKGAKNPDLDNNDQDDGNG